MINTISELSDLKKLQRRERRMLIVGPSGTGKSRVASSLNGIFHLDKIGTHRDGKWIVDVDKIPSDARVMEGTCDNMQEVVAKFKPTSLVIVRSHPALFRALQAMKVTNTDTPDKWRQCWWDKAMWNDVQIHRYFNEKIGMYSDLVKAIIPDIKVTVYVNRTDKQVPKGGGWHED